MMDSELEAMCRVWDARQRLEAMPPKPLRGSIYVSADVTLAAPGQTNLILRLGDGQQKGLD